MDKEKHGHQKTGDGHLHDHSHSNIKIATFLNISFTIVEFIGGALTNSLAILTDALHDLGDSLVLISSWKIEKIAARKPDWEKTFGYKRFSLLAAFLNAVILVGGSIIVFFQVVGRLFNPQPVHAEGAIILAFIGIAANTIGSLRLKGSKSVNEKILSWHLLEDVFGWVGILIAGIIMLFTQAYILDPLITIFFIAFVLWGAWRNSKELFNIFLEGTPSEIPIKSIVEEIGKIDHIERIYDVHLWSLEGKHNIFSMKAIVDKQGKKDYSSIHERIRKILSEYKIGHSTIDLEEEKFYSKEKPEQEFLEEDKEKDDKH